MALLVLALAAFGVGVPATLAPHAFYAHYPFLGHWVDRRPPYNQHLTTDVGEFELAFGVLFLWAARHRSSTIIVPVCLAWALSQTVHALYHVAHLEHFDAGDAVAEITGFAIVVGLALLAAARSRHDGSAAVKPPSRAAD